MRPIWRTAATAMLLVALAGCCTTAISGVATTGGSTGGSTTASTGSGPPSQCPPSTYQTSPGPISPRNYAGAAFGSDGLAYIAGGAPEGGGTIDLVEVLNPDSGVVTTGPPMLSPHSSFAFLASADHRTLYAIGGYDFVGPTTSAESFDVAAQKWSALPPLLAAGPTLGAVLADGRIVVIFPEMLDADGGATVEVFEDGGWVSGPSVPADGYADKQVGAGVGVGETVYSVNQSFRLRAWDLSADAGAWRLVLGPNTDDTWVVDPSAAQGPQELVISGGLRKGGDCTSHQFTERFDFGASDAGATPLTTGTDRDTAAAAIGSDGRMFVFAGETTGICCIGSTGSVSIDYLGSYEVIDLDAGV